jgi:DNA-binding NtrC family response regulator
MAPDLLISDIMMPVLSGAELAQHIQWSYPECSVLLFTGEWDRADTAIAAFEDGLRYQLIPKPVHPKQLIQKVHEMLAIAPVPPATEEDRARLRTMENMKQTFASVQAEIAITTARKRSARRRIAHHSRESRPAS